MQITIEVPDDSPLVQEIESWKDGAEYMMNARQTGTGEFTLVSAKLADPADSDEENNEGDEPAPDAKYKNPAMAAMIGAGKPKAE